MTMPSRWTVALATVSQSPTFQEGAIGMIVVMKSHCSEESIEHVLAFLENHGLSGHPSRGVERTIIGVLGAVGPTGTPGSIGGINPALGEALESFADVESVLRVSKPYKLASREFHPEDTIVAIPTPCVSEGAVHIGASAVVMMAGPCTVESEKQLMTTALAVRKEGATILRGGAFKPSTSPYGFRGMGEEGLKLLAKARAEFGLAVTIEEWLLAAEYVLSQGNRNVILCERGIRTFEKMTRNTMDISAIPLIKRLSHLPIISDPSQGTAGRDLVI